MGAVLDANTVRPGVLMQRIDPGIFQVAEGAAEFLSNPITARKRKARSKRLAADKPTILVVDDHKIIADTTAEDSEQVWLPSRSHLRLANGAADRRKAKSGLFAHWMCRCQL